GKPRTGADRNGESGGGGVSCSSAPQSLEVDFTGPVRRSDPIPGRRIDPSPDIMFRSDQLAVAQPSAGRRRLGGKGGKGVGRRLRRSYRPLGQPGAQGLAGFAGG